MQFVSPLAILQRKMATMYQRRLTPPDRSLADYHIGLEIKAGKSWKREYGKTLKTLLHSSKIGRAYGIYLGEKELQDDGVSVLPIETFLDRLWAGNIFK